MAVNAIANSSDFKQFGTSWRKIQSFSTDATSAANATFLDLSAEMDLDLDADGVDEYTFARVRGVIIIGSSGGLSAITGSGWSVYWQPDISGEFIPLAASSDSHGIEYDFTKYPDGGMIPSAAGLSGDIGVRFYGGDAQDSVTVFIWGDLV